MAGLKAEVVELRNKCRKALNVPGLVNLRALLLDARLHPTKLVGKSSYRKIMQGNDLTETEKQSVLLSIAQIHSKIKT